ncbi:MAG: LptF/LptG family permease [Henriciella sp.]|jgi:lipopolysaccharide export system permease protein
MQRIQRYIFSECTRVFFGLLLLVVSILLLERLLRIADLVSRSPGNLGEAVYMLANLIPHYAGIGIPAAFFLAVLITISRISRSGELVAVWGMGKSLFMISKPFMIMAVFLASTLLITSGILQPLSRYEYRSLVNSIAESSIETVFIEGKFVEAEDWTVWTEDVDLNTGELTSSFILERLPDGGQRIISASTGALVRQNGTISEIQLESGMGADLREDRTLGSRLEFESFQWRPPEALTQFRPRGKDVRELMLWELWAPETLSQQAEREAIEPLEAMVSIHDQFARFVLILILPLIAVPFGLSYGRHPPSNAILIGLLTLIIIQQLLELAKSLALDGAVPAWAGSWGVIIIVGIAGLSLFLRSAMTMAQPPLSSVPAIRLPRFLSSKSDTERPAS